MPRRAGLQCLLPAAAMLTAIPLAVFYERGNGAKHWIVLAQEKHDPTVSKAKWETHDPTVSKAKLEKMKAAKTEQMEKAKAAGAEKSEEAKVAAAEKMAKAKAEKMAAGKKRKDNSDNDTDAVPGKGKRECPPGQRPAPSRGRGGDAGGCI
jgi:hypothetical protein